MKTAEEFVQDAVANLGEKYSPKEKARYEEILRKVAIEGVPLSDALGMSPQLLESIYGYAYRLYNTGNYEDASILFAFLINLDLSMPKYYMGLAACFHRQKKYREAVGYYLASYSIDLIDPIPFYHLYDCWIHLNDFENALFALTMVMELGKDDPQYRKIVERSKLAFDSLVRELTEKEKAEKQQSKQAKQAGKQLKQAK